MGGWDLIVGSDILYELPKVVALAKALKTLLSEEGEAWIADPGRSFLQSYEKALEAEGLTCEVDALRITNRHSKVSKGQLVC
jgi:predicted nicotinamide N-methyase